MNCSFHEVALMMLPNFHVFKFLVILFIFILSIYFTVGQGYVIRSSNV